MSSTKEPRKFIRGELTTVLFGQALVASFFALILAWNNSREPIILNYAIIIYIFWVSSVGLGAMKIVKLSKISNPVLAGILSICGAILGYVFHWFWLYFFSGGACGGLFDFIINRLDQGIVIETIRRGSSRSYLTEVGREALLIVWSLEPILYLYSAYLGATFQADKALSKRRNPWE